MCTFMDKCFPPECVMEFSVYFALCYSYMITCCSTLLTLFCFVVWNIGYSPVYRGANKVATSSDLSQNCSGYETRPARAIHDPFFFFFENSPRLNPIDSLFLHSSVMNSMSSYRDKSNAGGRGRCSS